MWKMLVAFIIFAAIALTVVFKAGDKADMQGEAGGHSEQAEAKKEGAAEAPAAAPAAAAPAAASEGEKK